MNKKNKQFVITICSGKGGVGKSVLSANIGYELSVSGYKVLIWDADMYFPNQHILFGVEPPVRLNSVYTGEIQLESAVFTINSNLFLLADSPSSSKNERIKPAMLHDVYMQIMETCDFDFIIIDSIGGASSEVIQCCSLADIIGIVINDEPTSLLDAYGLIKILLQYFNKEKIKLLVNNVIDSEDAEEFSYKLNLATENFLGINLESIGYVPYDRIVRQSIMKQELFMMSENGNELTNSIKKITEVLTNLVNIHI